MFKLIAIAPRGQDTWTILSAKGEYYLDEVGTKRSILAGDVVIAPVGCVHGVLNNGDEPLIFISVVSPPMQDIISFLEMIQHLGFARRFSS